MSWWSGPKNPSGPTTDPFDDGHSSSAQKESAIPPSQSPISDSELRMSRDAAKSTSSHNGDDLTLALHRKSVLCLAF